MHTPIQRRACLLTLSTGLILPASAQVAGDGPITLVAPFAAGGTSDLVSRAVAKGMAHILDRPVVVANRAGAGGTVGLASVAKAVADGTTLVMGGLGSTVFPSVLYAGRLGYDAARDFTLVGPVASAPTVIAVRSGLPVRSLPELIALARAQPNTLSYGSAGVGGTLHVAGVLLEREAGIQLIHVPYRGGAPAMADLAAGAIDLALADFTLVRPLLASGRIRLLAVASAERHPAAPDTPTTAELGQPGVRMHTWYALLAHSATPTPVLTRLRQALDAARNQGDFAAVLAAQGLTPLNTPTAQFEAQIRQDFTRWPPLLRQICAQNACQ